MPLDPLALALCLAVVLLAAFVRATWGFGDAMVAIPLLSLIVSMRTASPMLALVNVTLALLLLRERPGLLEKAVIARLLLGALAGIPLGLYVLTDLPEAWARRGLGTLLIVMAVAMLVHQRRAKRVAPPAPRAPVQGLAGVALDLGFGALVGACSAAFDISGPILLLHAGLRGWSPEQLRMNLQAVFLPLGLLTMGGHALAGLWTREVLLLAACCLPIALLALALAARTRERLSGERGTLALHLLILALGLLLVIA